MCCMLCSGFFCARFPATGEFPQFLLKLWEVIDERVDIDPRRAIILQGIAIEENAALRRAVIRLPSGAWQKYPYRQRYGIIRAKNGQVPPKGCSYDHHHFAVSRRLPQGADDRTTTGLLGADCPPSDQSPAAGAARQDSFGTGNGSHPVPRHAPDAPQSRDGTDV